MPFTSWMSVPPKVRSATAERRSALQRGHDVLLLITDAAGERQVQVRDRGATVLGRGDEGPARDGLDLFDARLPDPARPAGREEAALSECRERAAGCRGRRRREGARLRERWRAVLLLPPSGIRFEVRHPRVEEALGELPRSVADDGLLVLHALRDALDDILASADPVGRREPGVDEVGRELGLVGEPTTTRVHALDDVGRDALAPIERRLAETHEALVHRDRDVERPGTDLGDVRFEIVDDLASDLAEAGDLLGPGETLVDGLSHRVDRLLDPRLPIGEPFGDALHDLPCRH